MKVITNGKIAYQSTAKVMQLMSCSYLTNILLMQSLKEVMLNILTTVVNLMPKLLIEIIKVKTVFLYLLLKRSLWELKLLSITKLHSTKIWKKLSIANVVKITVQE